MSYLNKIAAARGETFRYFGMQFDVEKAQKLCKGKPVETLKPEPGWIPAMVHVDKEHVEKVTLEEPVIFATVVLEKTPYNLLIDGNHRVTKALATGEMVKTVTLDFPETMKIMEALGSLKRKMMKEARELGLLPKKGA